MNETDINYKVCYERPGNNILLHLDVVSSEVAWTGFMVMRLI